MKQENTLKTRQDQLDSDTWDASSIYKNIEAWEKDFNEIAAKLPLLEQAKGKIKVSAKSCREVLDLFYETYRKAELVYTYTKCLIDVDTTNQASSALSQRAMQLFTRISAATSFLRPEIMDLPEATAQSYLEDKSLESYQRVLAEILRFRPHVLTDKEEKLLALGSEALSGAERIFSKLTNADFDFGTIAWQGQALPLSHSTFSLYLKDQNQELRKLAHQSYYGVYRAHENSITEMLVASIERDVFHARARNYSSAREASLFSDNIKPEVYDNLVTSVSTGIACLHRYYQFRKQTLGLKTQNIYDTYVPIVEKVETNIAFDEGIEILLSALRPLGEDYVSVLSTGLKEARWCDRYENKGKISGAYSGGCHDTYPFILMNYKATDIRDLFTLAHEAGHSMHSYYARKNQAYQDSDYTIFVAEVASTFNEQLLFRELKKRYAHKPEMLKFLTNQQIDDIKATFFRQTMFAEFERDTHATMERHEPLTLEVLRKIYRKLLEKYFGPSVTISELDELEFLRIPHFYHAFYVYKYATGISAAIALSQKVMQGDVVARDRYLSFLKTGGAKYPLEVLSEAGVDMTKSDAVNATIARFDELLIELESS
ncbi:oligoendopeptidase F [bacterium]|nr:oligoendopeptidase F [bacterium]